MKINSLNSILALLIGATLLIWLKLGLETTNEPEAQWHCGVVDMVERNIEVDNDTINVLIGKKLFKENCATCHNKDMKSKLTGPPLGDAIVRFEQDTLDFIRYVRNSKTYLAYKDDERIRAMKKNYGYASMDTFDLSSNEIRSILSYIENYPYSTY